ncbi:unnamed protein product [Arabidopsis halleri]
MEMVEELWKKGQTPCFIACTTLVQGLRKSERVEKASGFMEKMMNAGILRDDLKPMRQHTMFLVSGFTKEGRRKEREVIVNEMWDKDMLPDIFTYNRLMDSLSCIGKFCIEASPDVCLICVN